MAGTETPPVAAGLADTLEAETADTSQTLADSVGEQLAANPEAGGEQTEAGGGEEGRQQDAAARDEERAVEPEPEPDPPPPPPPGRLVLTGLPEGAVVRVGGRTRQETNIRLSPGRYQIVVQADGYEDFTQNVRIIDHSRGAEGCGRGDGPHQPVRDAGGELQRRRRLF